MAGAASRRSRLALLGIASWLLATCDAREPAAARPGPGQEVAYAVQLHVHGSFSEGVGSIDSHSYEASQLPLDVLWWSDHDFRIGSYGHESSLGFEDWAEPMEQGGKAVDPGRGGRRVKGLVPDQAGSTAEGTARFVSENPREGARSLRLSAASEQSGFASYRMKLAARRGLFKRPLASRVTLELSILPESVEPDARPFVEVELSEHAPREGLPLEVYRLRYVIDRERTRPWREGTLLTVPLAHRPGEWNDLVLPVSRDVESGFPFIRGEDNSLGTIFVGIEARRGASAAARFDRLRIRQEIEGPRVFDRQRELIGAIARDYPNLAQLQGVELSLLATHLNEFSVDTRLVDYDRVLAEARAEAVAKGAGADGLRKGVVRRLVAEIHARGGLVSYNHMYGVGMSGSQPQFTREQMLEELLREQIHGADLLEVGYRDRGGRSLEDHLWVWDRLAAGGLFPVGTGVSDSHGGPEQRWQTSPNNLVSWIYARSTGKADLIEGLRAGRVFFGDLVRFDGSVEITTAHARMGQIVVTDRAAEEVTLHVEGLEAGDSVRLVESGRDTATWTAQAASIEESRRVAIAARGPTLVRLAVHAPDGVAKVLSNPIVFVREPPERGIPAARAALELGGLVSRRISGFTLTGARSDAPGGTLVLSGRGTGGRLELECAACREAPSIRFEGVSARTSFTAPLLTLSGIEGTGTIRIAGLPAVVPAPDLAPEGGVSGAGSRGDGGAERGAPRGPGPARRGRSRPRSCRGGRERA